MDRNTYSEDGYKEMASSDETSKRGNTSGVSIIKSNNQVHMFLSLSHSSTMTYRSLRQPGRFNPWTLCNSLLEDAVVWPPDPWTHDFTSLSCLCILVCKMTFQQLPMRKPQSENPMLACSNCSVGRDGNNPTSTWNISSAIMWMKTLIYCV